MTKDDIICKSLWHMCKALSALSYGNNPNYVYAQLKIAMQTLEAHIGPQSQHDPRNPPDTNGRQRTQQDHSDF